MKLMKDIEGVGGGGGGGEGDRISNLQWGGGGGQDF